MPRWGNTHTSRPITVLGHHYQSLDAACQEYEINRAKCLKESKRQNVDVYEVILKKAEAEQRLRDMRQDFALGVYTRRQVNE